MIRMFIQLHNSTSTFIDSLWFDKYVAYDSLGLIGARFSDPDTLGNCYRWFAQRINSYVQLSSF